MKNINPIQVLVGKPLSEMSDAEINANIVRIQTFRATPTKLKEVIEDTKDKDEPPMKFVRPRKKSKVDQAAEDLLS